MTLWDMLRDQTSVIVDIEKDLPTTFKNRLEDLGFQIGEGVTCLRRPPFGAPRVYKVGQSVFSLAKDIASSITVSKESMS